MKTHRLILITAIVALAGCSFLQVQQARDFLIKAGGSILVNTLANIAANEMTGNNANYGNALSQAIWSTTGQVLKGDELYQQLDAATAGNLPKTTKAVVNAYRKVVVETNEDDSTPESRALLRAKAADALATMVDEIATKAVKHERHED